MKSEIQNQIDRSNNLIHIAKEEMLEYVAHHMRANIKEFIDWAYGAPTSVTRIFGPQAMNCVRVIKSQQNSLNILTDVLEKSKNHS